MPKPHSLDPLPKVAIVKGIVRSDLRDIEQALRLGHERSIKRQRLVYDAAFTALENLKRMVA